MVCSLIECNNCGFHLKKTSRAGI